MQENLTEIIKQYLKIETNYAIIINGNYGIGKTYFFKNSLFSEISNISLPNKEDKKYTPIHISLFGIKSIEDLQTQIFFGIYPILKKRSLKLATGIGKSLIRGIANLYGLGDINDFFADFDLNAKDWINYDELVLCLDDIDRKSDSLNIKDTLGFINTLVENYGAKVLIIANEEVLRTDKEYSTKLREKVIGISIEFIPNTELIFDLVINDRYSSSNSSYFDFLKEHKKTVIDIIQKNDNNLRNLIFFLEHFKIIYSSLISQFQLDPEFKISEEKKLITVLYFSLTIAFEYKRGNLNTSNFEEIRSINNVDLSSFHHLLNPQNNSDEVEVKKTYGGIFKEKYYDQNEFTYFDSIFIYLTGQASFHIDILKEELKKIFIIEEGNIPEAQKIMNKLGYFDCLNLTDNEYRDATYKMVGYVENGNITLMQIPSAFHFATRFDNVLRLNINKLKRRFKKGVSKCVSKNSVFDPHLHFRLSISEDTEFKEDLEEIVNYCIDSNNRLKEKQEKNSLDNIEKLLITDIGKFIQESYESRNQLHNKAFWIKFSMRKVYYIINQLSNNDIIELSFYFKERYRRSISTELYPEKNFLIELKKRINKPQKRKTKNLRNATLDFLIKHIDNSIKNFPQ